MISDEEAEKAIEFMADNAAALGAAKERVLRAEYMREVQEAFEYQRAEGKTVEAKKALARLTDEYKRACDEEAIAWGEWEKLKALQEAARHTVSVYQTQSANEREFQTAAHRGVARR
jgi:DNA repair exonuclease SbcCD ATPase subunit